MSAKMNRFQTWLETAEFGDVIMYLQADTAQRDRQVSAFFYQAAKDGKVFLYQKRIRTGVFNYYAKRIRPKAGRVLAPGEIYEY